MNDISYKKFNKKPNYLLFVLFVISLGIHTLILMRIAERFGANAESYIELTVANVEKPYIRAIPRPRKREPVIKTYDVDKLNIREHTIPKMNIEPFQNFVSTPVDESIQSPQSPDIPDFSDLKAAQFKSVETTGINGINGISGTSIAKTGELVSREEYFEMVRLKIESKKKYPESARKRHLEGNVKIGFVLDSKGKAEKIRIIKSSGRDILDQSAMNAVKNASPFPAPPQNLFSVPLAIEIAIVFELIQ